MNDLHNTIICSLCPHFCRIKEGEKGYCGARGLLRHPCTDELAVVSLNYGKLTSIALDPIEKKPLKRFHPGKKILSVGSFGCNLNCPWCQNFGISRASEEEANFRYVSPGELLDMAVESLPDGNIGVAFTYNEPLISIEYVRDTSKLLKGRGLKSVLVTNGYVSTSAFLDILPFIDAMNIDLKSIRKDFYKKIGGDLETIKTNINAAALVCHIELTCLLLNGENDSEQEMEEMTDFIASVSKNIPLHISRAFPSYKMKNKGATNVETMEKFREIAARKLKYVYLGNV